METLEIAEALEKAGIDRQKAYPIAETINGKSGLATKEDIHTLRSEMAEMNSNIEKKSNKEEVAKVRVDIAEVRTELKEEVAKVRVDIAEVNAKLETKANKEDIAEVRTELKENIAKVRTELKEDITEVRTELKENIAEVRTGLRNDIVRIETKIDSNQKWVRAIGIALVGGVISIIGLIVPVLIKVLSS